MLHKHQTNLLGTFFLFKQINLHYILCSQNIVFDAHVALTVSVGNNFGAVQMVHGPQRFQAAKSFRVRLEAYFHL